MAQQKHKAVEMEESEQKAPKQQKKWGRFTGPVSWSTPASQLYLDGYTVMPLLLSSEMAKYFKLLCESLRSMPEYIDAEASLKTGFVLGGFAALGNPSSFHNEFVRAMRMRIMRPAVRLFQEFLVQAGLSLSLYKVEQLVDRLLYRKKGDKPTAESFHRDQSPSLPEDFVFGGFVNCDPEGTAPQVFSCVSGTHTAPVGKVGFTPITKAEALKERYEERKIAVDVQPGEWLIFNQNLVHEVNCVVRKVPVMRLFTGWRLTQSDQPLFPENRAIMVRQGVIWMPSGQKPPMYAKMHWVNHVQKLIDWSKATFHDELLDNVTRHNGKEEKDEVIRVVAREMEDLNRLSLQTYDEYTQVELDILTPQRVHTLADGSTVSL